MPGLRHFPVVEGELSLLSISITCVCDSCNRFWVGREIVLAGVSSRCTCDRGHQRVKPPTLSPLRGEPPLLHSSLCKAQGSAGEDLSVIQLGRMGSTGNEGQGAVAVDNLTDSFSLCLENRKLTSVYFSY